MIDYLLHLAIFIGLYAMLAQSLNLAAGYAGLMSLAHAGFYGVGAYTTAILSVEYGWNFWLNVPVAMLVSGSIALVVGLAALRTVDDYFIICTLGVQVIVFSIMNNWMELTRGPLGIPGIPSIGILGFTLDNKMAFLVLTVVLASLQFFLIRNVMQSSFGNVLLAASEDEIFTQSLGKNVASAKMVAFTLSAVFATIPGALYAHYVSYIDPSSFTTDESIFILAIVVIGGRKNTWGSLASAAFLVLLPEALRFLNLPNSTAANLHQIIYGLLLIAIVMRKYKRILIKTMSKDKFLSV